MDKKKFEELCVGKAVCRFEKVSREQFLQDGGNDLGYDSIELPCRKTTGSSGYDFVSPVDICLEPGEAIVVPSGIRCQILEGYDLSIYPRSGLGFKYSVQLANTVGIIDNDYYYSDNEGHIMVKLVNRGNKVLSLQAGSSFCQGIIREYFLSVDDNVTNVRNGGFGSTGV